MENNASECLSEIMVCERMWLERVMREYSWVRELFCTLIVVAVIGVQIAVKIHRHIYQEKKKVFFSIWWCLKYFFKRKGSSRTLLIISASFHLARSDFHSSPRVSGQCCFWGGLCHHLSGLGNSCRWLLSVLASHPVTPFSFLIS